MFDEYLKTQNKLLLGLNITISTFAVIHAALLLGHGHMFFALFEFCVAIAICSGLSGITCRNNEMIKKWDAMNSVEYNAFSISDTEDLTQNIGNLKFDFKKPSE